MNIATEVDRIVRDCFIGEKEDGTANDGGVVVEGVIRSFAFSAPKIDEHKEEIRTLLNRMPGEFHKERGGGWSFLNLCVDKDGNQWGEQADVEVLCVLAIAAGLGRWCLSRDLWSVLPGGVPYIVFDTEKT